MLFATFVQQLCDLAPRCVPVLFDAALKGCLILMLCVGASRLMRRNSAAARHLVWFLGITSLALLPALALMLPSWRILPPGATPERVIAVHATAIRADGVPEAGRQSSPPHEL